jgi:hypothetical protein
MKTIVKVHKELNKYQSYFILIKQNLFLKIFEYFLKIKILGGVGWGVEWEKSDSGSG